MEVDEAASGKAKKAGKMPTRKKKVFVKPTASKKSDDEEDEDYVDEPEEGTKGARPAKAAKKKVKKAGKMPDGFVVGDFYQVTNYHSVITSPLNKDDIVVITGPSMSKEPKWKKMVMVKRYSMEKRRPEGKAVLANPNFLSSEGIEEVVASGKTKTASKKPAQKMSVKPSVSKKVEDDEKSEGGDYGAQTFEADAASDNLEMNEAPAKRGGGKLDTEPSQKKQTTAFSSPSAVVVTAKDQVPIAAAAGGAAKDHDSTPKSNPIAPTAVVTGDKYQDHGAVAAKNQVAPVAANAPLVFPSKYHAPGWKVTLKNTKSVCGNGTTNVTTYVSSRGEVQTHPPLGWQVSAEREYLEQEEEEARAKQCIIS